MYNYDYFLCTYIYDHSVRFGSKDLIVGIINIQIKAH